MTGNPPARPERRAFIAALGLLLLGCALIVVVPAGWKGPVLIPIDQTHAVRLMDAVGLAGATLGWLWLNGLENKRRAARREAMQKMQKKRK
jgi:hypothetical protein